MLLLRRELVQSGGETIQAVMGETNMFNNQLLSIIHTTYKCATIICRNTPMAHLVIACELSDDNHAI